MNLRRTISVAALVIATAVAVAAQQSQTQDAQTPSNSTNKGVVQARNQAEYDAYQAIKNKPQTPEEFEKAADDFAAKFPDSNLRIVLYRGVMQSYQQAQDGDKMMSAGLKVLGLDKDDPEALIVVAEIQEERTSPMDLDREQRMEQAIANAQHALQSIDTDLAIPAGTPDERVETYKKYLRSTALAIIGKIQYKQQQYPDAETTLRKALEADSVHPDPVVLLSLALSLDMQKKYWDALDQAKHAVELTKEDTDVGKSARAERDRLLLQTGANSDSQAASPPASGSEQTPAASGN